MGATMGLSHPRVGWVSHELVTFDYLEISASGEGSARRAFFESDHKTDTVRDCWESDAHLDEAVHRGRDYRGGVFHQVHAYDGLSMGFPRTDSGSMRVVVAVGFVDTLLSPKDYGCFAALFMLPSGDGFISFRAPLLRRH